MRHCVAHGILCSVHWWILIKPTLMRFFFLLRWSLKSKTSSIWFNFSQFYFTCHCRNAFYFQYHLWLLGLCICLQAKLVSLSNMIFRIVRCPHCYFASDQIVFVYSCHQPPTVSAFVALVTTACIQFALCDRGDRRLHKFTLVCPEYGTACFYEHVGDDLFK